MNNSVLLFTKTMPITLATKEVEKKKNTPHCFASLGSACRLSFCCNCFILQARVGVPQLLDQLDKFCTPLSGIHGNGVTLLCYEMCGRVQHFRKDMISRATETRQCRQEGMLGGMNKSNHWNGDRGSLRSAGHWHPRKASLGGMQQPSERLCKSGVGGEEYPSSIPVILRRTCMATLGVTGICVEGCISHLPHMQELLKRATKRES